MDILKLTDEELKSAYHEELNKSSVLAAKADELNSQMQKLKAEINELDKERRAHIQIVRRMRHIGQGKCAAIVFSDWSHHACDKPAKVNRFCGIHKKQAK